MSDITVCVTSCGELSEKKCLEAISPFCKEIELIRITNVYPQIKALNQMIRQTKTEYLLPVDADIVLNENAWAIIKNALNQYRHDPQWHSILFSLWDTLTERKILALKLLRTRIMIENPFKESATPDVEHYQRLTDMGYTCIHRYLKLPPIGKHIVKGKVFCYYKYRDVYQTYKAYGFEWDSGAFMGGNDLFERAKLHFHYFLYKWINTGNKDYLWCIAGMMDGIISVTENKSKDYTNRKCAMSIEAGIHSFMDWYMEFGPEFQRAAVKDWETFQSAVI